MVERSCKTVCPLCGVGCGVVLDAAAARAAGIGTAIAGPPAACEVSS